MLSTGKMETLTRIGFAARGLMYFTIGFVALRSGRAEDSAGALEQLSGAGRPLLLLMALGFVAYAIWRLSEAIIDSEGHGDDAKGLAVRAGGAVSGLLHVGLALVALRLGTSRPSGAGNGEQEGAATALSLPGGQWLLGLVAVILLVVGAYQLIKAVRGDFLKHLAPEAARQDWVKWAGRGGYAARGIVFLMIGLFAFRAASAGDSGEAGGMEAALAALPEALFVAVAIGFILFGAFSLVEARYRRINDPKVLDRMKARLT